MLDRVEEVRLAAALVAQDRHDLGVRRRRGAIQVDDAEELFAFLGEQFRDVVAGTDLVVGVAREVVAEGVPGAAQHLQGPVRQGACGGGGCHVEVSYECRSQNAEVRMSWRSF